MRAGHPTLDSTHLSRKVAIYIPSSYQLGNMKKAKLSMWII